MEANSCAICLDEQINTPVASQCGHILCAKCWMSVGIRGEQRIDCPICRTKVTLLIPLYGQQQQQQRGGRRGGGGGDGGDDDAVMTWIRNFNNAQCNRSLWAVLQEQYQLVQRGFRSTFAFKIAAFVSFLVVFLYLLSPVDIIPDAIPLVGRLDDLFVVILAFWIWHLLAEYERGLLFRR